MSAPGAYTRKDGRCVSADLICLLAHFIQSLVFFMEVLVCGIGEYAHIVYRLCAVSQSVLSFRVHGFLKWFEGWFE